MIGREGTRALVRRLDAKERALMEDLAILDYADRPLGSVPLAMRQRVEIGRALARDARVFLFDEPNSALTQEESSDLFRRMHLLADGGAVVILVSHRIAELAEHAARVALILDGRCTGILEGDALTQEGIAAGLVSGQVGPRAGRGPRQADERRRRDGHAPHRLDGHARGAFAGHRPRRPRRRDRRDRGRRGVGRPRARALDRRVRARHRLDRDRRRCRRRRRGRGDRPRLRGPRGEPVREPHHRRQHGLAARQGDRRPGDRPAPRPDGADRARAPRAVRGEGDLARACRSARCRAATSRRSPSRRRS